MSELTERNGEKGSVGVREDGGLVETNNEGDLGQASPSHPRTLSASRTQTLWAALLIEEFIRQGVGLFVLAPGSRCTPLTVAVAENPRANHILHFDERGGAFAALGFARATGKPAVLITTSGTAVANGFPALIEADADGVPLIMLTADRPPELRETGANQTIRQPSIFGQYVRWQFDLPVPDPAIDPAFVLTTASQAAHRSMTPAGPVHVNCMFREPLVPEGNGLEAAEGLSGLSEWLSGDRHFTRYPVSSPSVSGQEIKVLATRLEHVERGLVVLGKSDDPAIVEAAKHFSSAQGWPLLPDVASGGRLGSGVNSTHFDLLLSSPRFRDTHQPAGIVHLGGKITSKRLQQFIEEATPADYVVVRSDAARYDPGHLVTDRIQSDVVRFCKAISDELVTAPGTSAWMQAWEGASNAAEKVVDGELASDDLSEPSVARAVSRLTPEGHGLVAASSMPIRDLDSFAVSNGPRLRVAANRGASGIDGTVATAAGFARGLDQPSTLLIGDLALLHDLNSLALLRDGPPVTVVVLNNDGGGIFSFLPIAEREGVFEPYFGTPHGIGFERAAQLFGLEYEQPDSMAEFDAAYTKATSGEVSSVIEICTDRNENVALHRTLIEAIVESVDASLKL